MSAGEKKLHVIVILDRKPWLSDEGEYQLIEDQIERIRTGVSRYKHLKEKGENVKIICTGKGQDHLPSSHARLIKDFILTLDQTTAEDILLEERSMDTIGNVIFIRMLICNLWAADIQSLTFVSSQYHIARVKAIVERVFGIQPFNISFEASITPKHYDLDMAMKNEDESLKAFQQTFRNVLTGDLDTFYNTLIQMHSLYVHEKINAGCY